MELGWIADLDGDAACVAVEDSHARLVAAEVEQFFLAAHWVCLHDGDALEDARRRRGEPARGGLPGMEQAKRAGADGTPRVTEFAAMELGALLGVHHLSAAALMRDAVNVFHRHPRLAEALKTGEAGGVRVWQARKIAQACAAAGLDRDQARWVDEVTTPYAASLRWGRLEDLVEAKIIEADPEAAQARTKAAAMARFVRTGRTSEHGLRTLIARGNAGDMVIFTAMVDRIAAILAERGDTDTLDVRRSKAIGILATPARALLMLAEAAQAAQAAEDCDDLDDPEDPRAGAADANDADADDDDVDARDDSLDGAEDEDGTDGEDGEVGEAGEDGEDGGAGDAPQDGRPGSAVALRRRDDKGPRERASLIPEARFRGAQRRDDTDNNAAGEAADAADTGPSAPAATVGPGGGSPTPPDSDSGGGLTFDPADFDFEPDLLTPLDLHPAADDADDAPEVGTGPCPTCGSASTAAAGGVFAVAGQYIRPGPLLEALQSIDPAKLLPSAVLYLHAHETMLRTNTSDSGPVATAGTVGRVARMEDVGPLTRDQVIEFLGHHSVKPVRVIDIPGQQPVDGYEIPVTMKDALHLLHPACAAPFAVNLGRRKDGDHVRPYRPASKGGEPGQTHLGNLAPLTRLPHRAKTHGRWSLTQDRPGEWTWRSPHGYRYRVDATGTHPLGKDDAGDGRPGQDG